jgi:hypothetical protein
MCIPQRHKEHKDLNCKLKISTNFSESIGLCVFIFLSDRRNKKDMMGKNDERGRKVCGK